MTIVTNNVAAKLMAWIVLLTHCRVLLTQQRARVPQKWTGGVVPYDISSKFNSAELKVILETLAVFDEMTGGCVRFKPQKGEFSYLQISLGTQSWSYYGMPSGMALNGLRLKKVGRYDVATGSLFLLPVQLLDNSVMECTMNDKSTGQDLLHHVAQRLTLGQWHYFGLKFISKHMQYQWLDLDQPLRHYLSKYAHQIHLKFCVRFYILDISQMKIDDATRYHFFLQLRSEIIEGALLCSCEQAVLLAAYSLQAAYGDYVSERHTPRHLKDFFLLPKRMSMEEDMLFDLLIQVSNTYHSFMGMSPAAAETFYILEAQNLQGYGEEYYAAQDSSGNDLLLGTSWRGVGIKHPTGRPILSLPWANLKSVTMTKKRSICLECHGSGRASQKIIQIFLENAHFSVYVLSNISLQQEFYRQNTPRVASDGHHQDVRDRCPELSAHLARPNSESASLPYSTSSQFDLSTHPPARNSIAVPGSPVVIINHPSPQSCAVTTGDVCGVPGSDMPFEPPTSWLNGLKYQMNRDPVATCSPQRISNSSVKSTSQTSCDGYAHESPTSSPAESRSSAGSYSAALSSNGNVQEQTYTAAHRDQLPNHLQRMRLAALEDLSSLHSNSNHNGRSEGRDDEGLGQSMCEPITTGLSFQKDKVDEDLGNDARRVTILNRISSGNLLIEFEQIPKKRQQSHRDCCSVAMLAENSARNRYPDLLPYDDTRILLLQPTRKNPRGYINASEIILKCESLERHYVAAQDPLEGITTEDCLSLLSQCQCCVVVVLSENGSAVPWECFVNGQQELSLDGFHLRRESVSEADGYRIVSFWLYDRRSKQSRRKIWAIHFYAWNEQGVPENMGDFCKMMQELESLRLQFERTPQKDCAVIMCRSGSGRSGLVVLYDFMRLCLDHNQVVDVGRVLTHMRLQRMHMVQTVSQYIFVYNALLKHLADARLI